MGEEGIRKFGGKAYRRRLRGHSKREAEAYAKGQRKRGYSARITTDRFGGHLNYNVWVRQ